jgi:hypothetical protein
VPAPVDGDRWLPALVGACRLRHLDTGLLTLPDEQSAIKQAIEEFKVPANQRDRLIARQRD